MDTIKEEIFAEISDIPEREIPDLIQLIRTFKAHRKTKNTEFPNINSWRGGLKDLDYTSVDMQHEISKVWRKKYVSD